MNTPEQEERCLNHFIPLKGIFDRDTFILHDVDTMIINYISDVVLDIVQSTACMISFFRHPVYTKGEDKLFYRWVVLDCREADDELELNLDEFDFKYDFNHPRNMTHGIISKEFGQNECLTFEILNEIAKELEMKPYHEINEIKLSPNKGVDKISLIKEHDENYWLLKEPYKCKSFVNIYSRVDRKRIQWSFYRPIYIEGRLAGLISIDGTPHKASEEKNITKAKLKKLTSALDLLELALSSLYHTYYAQLYPPPDLKYIEAKELNFMKDWDMTGLVYSNRFLDKLFPKEKSNTNQIPQYLKFYNITEYENGYIIFFCDANGIKSANDKFSHTIGNEIIRAVGFWLHESFWNLCCKCTKDKRKCKETGVCIERKPMVWVINKSGDEFVIIIVFPNEPKEENEIILDRLKDHFYNYMIHSLEVDKNSPSKSECFLAYLNKSFLKKKLLQGVKVNSDLNDLHSSISVAIGYFNNRNGQEKFDVAQTNAEEAMYAAKKWMKDRQIITKIKSNIYGLCLNYDYVNRELDSVIEHFPIKISEELNRNENITS